MDIIDMNYQRFISNNREAIDEIGLAYNISKSNGYLIMANSEIDGNREKIYLMVAKQSDVIGQCIEQKRCYLKDATYDLACRLARELMNNLK